MLFVLGGAGYGASEVGEVLATFDRIHGKGDSYRATYEEFLRLGRQVKARGDKERDGGRRDSARSSYLRAAMYLDQALYFALASDKPTRKHEGALYKEMGAAWASAGGNGRRPTVILNTGSDAQNIDMYVYGGAAALERGWNALIFEEPGQGSNLFLRNQAFIPGWERVITPIVDWLRGRPEVDRKRISLVGQSFGGYLTARAAAYEHRSPASSPTPASSTPSSTGRKTSPTRCWSCSTPPCAPSSTGSGTAFPIASARTKPPASPSARRSTATATATKR